MKRFWILVSILWLATCGGGGGSPTEPKEPAPVANFTATPTTLIQGQAVTFTSTSTGTITSYAWNVDDDPAIEGTTATYTHTYEEVGTYSVTLTVTGPGGSNPKTSPNLITVSSAAPTPTTATNQSVQEDGTTTINLTATDPNGQAVTFAITTDPSNGTASLSGSTLTYTPDTNFYGTDTVAYTASNGTYTSDPVTITITVEGEDDGDPTTNDISATTDEDTAVTLTLDATEIDGDSYSFAIRTQPSNGTLGTISNNQVTYTPNENWNGEDTFTFEATDDRAFNRRNIATATITVNAVNDAPVANDVTASMNENKIAGRYQPVTITLDATDVEGDDLTYSIIGTPSNGTLGSISDNQIIYTPSQDYNGEDTFTYKANDGTDDSNTATVTVTINAVNDAPVTEDQSASTDEDTAVEITLTATDVENDNLSFTIVSDVSNGTTSLSGATVTYTPDSNWNGQDTFTFKANDGTDDSNTSTVTITINPVNDAPVANDVTASTQSRTGNMRQAVNITLDATDVDGDDLTYSLVSDVSNGTTSLSDNIVTYTPTANYDGTDTFTYKANDGTDDSNTATGTITVENVNLIPTLVDTLFSKFISNSKQDHLYVNTVALNLKEILNDDNPNDNTFSIVETLNLGNASIITDQLVYTPDLLDFFPQVATTPNNVHHVRGGIKSDLIKIVSYDGENNSNIATVEVELKKQADVFYRKNSNLQFNSSVMDSDGLVLYSRTPSQIGRVLKIDDDSGDLIWEYDFSNTSEGSYTHFYYGKIKKHSDGSYIFTCNVHLNINTLTLYIGKVSSSGSSFEYKVYNNGEDIRARDFVETNDGNLVIGLLSGGIMKVNGSLNGDIIWKKELDYSSDNFVDSTSDGGVITIGHNSALQKQMLRKIDSSGEVEWTKLFDGNRSSGIKTTPEGGYIFDVDYTIYKADSAGDIEWNFSTSNYGDIVINVIQLTSDGGYIFGGGLYLNGISQARTFPAWVKLSSAGSVEWDHQSFDNMGQGFYVNGIDESVDGGFLLSGNVYNYYGNAGVAVEHSAGWILKINSQGERVWPNLSD